MITRLPLEGALLIEPTPFEDHRGRFLRLWDQAAYREAGMALDIAQAATSSNHRRGTLRGLHYQLPPAAEAKLIRCVQGALYDVMVDLRPGSSTFGRWWATTLRASDSRLVYIPQGFAHGYQALEDGSVCFYTMSAPYTPELARGVRWDDPALAIPWPVADPVLSERDAALPRLSELPG